MEELSTKNYDLGRKKSTRKSTGNNLPHQGCRKVEEIEPNSPPAITHLTPRRRYLEIKSSEMKSTVYTEPKKPKLKSTIYREMNSPRLKPTKTTTYRDHKPTELTNQHTESTDKAYTPYKSQENLQNPVPTTSSSRTTSTIYSKCITREAKNVTKNVHLHLNAN
jgi:hypothetical protein